MRGKKHTRHDKKNGAMWNAGPKVKTVFKVWAVVYVALLILFTGQIIHTDILPPKYLYSGLAIAGILSMFIFPLLYFDYIRRNRKIIAAALSVVLAVVFGVGTVYLQNTDSFFSQVTTVSAQTRDYYVVVKKDSDYQNVQELVGRDVGTYMMTSADYSTAKNTLNSRVKVNMKISDKFSQLDDSLLKGKVDAIFVGQAMYNMMCEKVKGFKGRTRILYTIRMDVSGGGHTKEVDVTRQAFNIYISGLDTAGKITETSRSDVNMIVTVNPLTHTILLTSIPRDYQIQLTSYGNANDKLTHTGIYGIDESVKSVERLMGVNINYSVKVNYTTVKKLINAIGGVDVVSDYDFVTHGQAAHYTFRKGKNHLDGAKALAFARERKSFTDGDVQRNRDQAKVMEAVLKKATSSTTILTSYTSILNSIKDYTEINMKGEQIRELVKMQVSGGYHWKIIKQNLTGTGAYDTCYSSGDYQVYVMMPLEDKVDQASKKIVRVMDGSVK